MKSKLTIFLFSLCFPGFAGAQQTKINLSTATGRLCFEVTYKGEPTISSSPLGMNIDNIDLGKSVEIKSVEQTDAEYKTYTIEKKDGDIYHLDIREFDNGIALRYRIPSTGSRCVYGEETSFTFPAGTRVWYASGPFQYGWIQAYQDRTTDKIENELLAPPATFRLPNGIYAAITEANLFNFHGAVLFGHKNNRVQLGYVDNKGHLETGIITGIPASKYWHEEIRNSPWIVSPRNGSKEIITPWRILMLSENLDGLVNNRIIAQVSDQPDRTLFPEGKNTQWIKPGRSIFTWLVEGENRLSVENHKRYVDGAAELGLESVVVDDGWELWPKTEKNANGRTKWELLKELVDYARSKNVDIWVWRPSSPRYGNKSDVGLLDADERNNFMKRCAEIGVKGLKIDFFHTENLFTVNFMENILKDAAKAHLMVIFHGVNKPTGDSYTYPNLLAKEAVRGLESVGGENNWAPGPPWPYHNTVLPFTRWLAGPADYTPLNFRQFCPPSVTFTHQLASIYTFTSPMLIFAADMEDMLACPGRMFIEEVPVTWDQTKILKESRIGELAALSRRKGDIWYLSILNGEKAVTQEIELDFLPKGNYRMTYASDDGENRKKIVINNRKIKSGKTLKIKLLSGGGYLAKFERTDK
ncbi:glycoside hydrolase family 97 catalytic domain-containing protein [Bacteroides sp.]|uniref:glycoside hydrolase family 97 catalytic domain-containing protein n=1 Tax=Bacteroides sp. TaxID=29523 RepID=UPI0040269D4B